MTDSLASYVKSPMQRPGCHPYNLLTIKVRVSQNIQLLDMVGSIWTFGNTVGIGEHKIFLSKTHSINLEHS